MKATGDSIRTCTACLQSFPATLEFFVSQKSCKSGLTSTCKVCRKLKVVAWRSENIDKVRAVDNARYQRDKLKRLALSKKWRDANPDKAKENTSAWITNNAEHYSAVRKAYREANAENIKANYAIWYAANRESEIASAAARRAANPDKDRANARKWYQENKVRGRVSRNAWLAANPAKKRVYSENRRARKLGSNSLLSVGLVDRLFEFQGGKCACCGEVLTEYHLDHRMPLALGGAHADDNMQLLTPRCNMMKGSRHPDEYIKYRESLNI